MALVLAPARSAYAATTCVLAGTTLSVVMATDLAAHEYVVVLREGDDISVFERGIEVACTGGTPTVTTVDLVDVDGSGAGNVLVSLAGGPFAPGATSEPSGNAEIEFDLSFPIGHVGDPEVWGSPLSDHLVMGIAGINLNPDEVTDDADVVLTNARLPRLDGRLGDDEMSAAGGEGTGEATTASIVLVGGGDDDMLAGGRGADNLDGFSGIDSLDGGAGADTLMGSGQNDVLHGGEDDDSLMGEDGDDVLDGGAGNDTMIWEAGADTYVGGFGSDQVSYVTEMWLCDDPFSVAVTLDGLDNDGGLSSTGVSEADNVSSDIESLAGGSTRDTFVASAGSVRFTGGSCDDTLLGATGNDVLEGGSQNDLLNGGAGADTLSGDWDDDILRGGGGPDFLVEDGIDDGNDSLDGGSGDDFLAGGAGADSLVNGPGGDIFRGGGGVDRISYSHSPAGIYIRQDDQADDGRLNEHDLVGVDVEQIVGSAYNDHLIGSSLVPARNLLVGRDGNDILKGAAGRDRLLGGAGGDELFGGLANDILEGGSGADLLDGGAGRDTCHGGPGVDEINHC